MEKNSPLPNFSDEEMDLLRVYCVGSDDKSNAAWAELFDRYIYEFYKAKATQKCRKVIDWNNLFAKEKYPLDTATIEAISTDWINKTFARLRRLAQLKGCPNSPDELNRYMNKSLRNIKDILRKALGMPPRPKPQIRLKHILRGTAEERKLYERVKAESDKRIANLFTKLSDENNTVSKFLTSRINREVHRKIDKFVDDEIDDNPESLLKQAVKELNKLIKQYNGKEGREEKSFLYYKEFEHLLNDEEKEICYRWLDDKKVMIIPTTSQYKNRDMLSRAYPEEIDPLGLKSTILTFQSKSFDNTELKENIGKLIELFDKLPRVQPFVRDFFQSVLRCLNGIEEELLELSLWNFLEEKGKHTEKTLFDCLRKIYAKDTIIRSYKRYLRLHWRRLVEGKGKDLYENLEYR